MITPPFQCDICQAGDATIPVTVNMPGLRVLYRVCSGECEDEARARGKNAWEEWGTMLKIEDGAIIGIRPTEELEALLDGGYFVNPPWPDDLVSFPWDHKVVRLPNGDFGLVAVSRTPPGEEHITWSYKDLPRLLRDHYIPVHEWLWKRTSVEEPK